MDEGSPRSAIEQLERDIERLSDAAERCRKFIFAAKVAIVLGALVMLALFFGVVRGPEALIAATAASIGGIVTLGTNVSTLDQLVKSLDGAQQLRRQMIGRLDLHLVGEAGHDPMHDAARPPARLIH